MNLLCIFNKGCEPPHATVHNVVSVSCQCRVRSGITNVSCCCAILWCLWIWQNNHVFEQHLWPIGVVIWKIHIVVVKFQRPVRGNKIVVP